MEKIDLKSSLHTWAQEGGGGGGLKGYPPLKISKGDPPLKNVVGTAGKNFMGYFC